MFHSFEKKKKKIPVGLIKNLQQEIIQFLRFGDAKLYTYTAGPWWFKEKLINPAA